MAMRLSSLGVEGSRLEMLTLMLVLITRLADPDRRVPHVQAQPFGGLEGGMEVAVLADHHELSVDPDDVETSCGRCPLRDLGNAGMEIVDQLLHGCPIGRIFRARRVETEWILLMRSLPSARDQSASGGISEVPAPIS